MKQFRSTVILFFAFSLFVGSAGIHVFEHFCKMDGTDYSFFVPTNHACKPIQKVESCCDHAKNEKQASIKQNCCEDELVSYQITSDFIQKDNQTNPFIALLNLVEKPIFVQRSFPLKNTKSAYFVNRPPPKKGQEILILNQVFRI